MKPSAARKVCTCECACVIEIRLMTVDVKQKKKLEYKNALFLIVKRKWIFFSNPLMA